MRAVTFLVLLLSGMSFFAQAQSTQRRNTSKPADTPDFLQEHRLIPQQGQFYVVARFSCIDNNDGSSRGSCDVYGYGNSCAAAQQVVASKATQADPCIRCESGVQDNTRHGNGNVQCIQDGPCRGQACH